MLGNGNQERPSGPVNMLAEGGVIYLRIQIETRRSLVKGASIDC